jgi:coenzyme F420-reducing hydrogenase delta subunit/ferredoxin
VRAQAVAWLEVVHTQLLPSACSPDAARAIGQAIQDHGLEQIVLAACACCAADQVCNSCSYQRLRCKSQWGIYSPAGAPAPRLPVEFVNLREQCAWPHASDPAAATAKAIALVAAAIAGCSAAPAPVTLHATPLEKSALVLGSGEAAAVCVAHLHRLGIAARQFPAPLEPLQHRAGRFAIPGAGEAGQAAALVLAPQDAHEAVTCAAAFGRQPAALRMDRAWDGLDGGLPGAFYCDPGLPPALSGAAAAGRVAAWLERASHAAPLATVETWRCRACGACVEICEFAAIELVTEGPQRHAWIDPARCIGCGACAAGCPSGAILPACGNEAQIEAMLQAYHRAAQARHAPPYTLLLTCNWNGYSGLNAAGAQRLPYAATVYPLKVSCLGQLNPGTILKAFARGAGQVLLVGCPPCECHYQSGGRRAEQVFAEAQRLAALLGIGEAQLRLEWAAAAGNQRSDGQAFAAAVRRFTTAGGTGE